FLVPSRTYSQLPARKQFLLRCGYRWRQDRAVIDRMKAVQNVVAFPVSARRDAIVILEDFAVVTEDLVDFLLAPDVKPPFLAFAVCIQTGCKASIGQAHFPDQPVDRLFDSQ